MSAHPVSPRSPLVIEHPPRVRCVRIEWGVSRMALGDRAPHGSASLVTLRYQATPDSEERWSLLDPTSGCVAPIPHPPGGHPSLPTIRFAGQRVHIHSPTLYAFISLDNADNAELLYARTPIFEMLKVGGGRYQPLDASVELA